MKHCNSTMLEQHYNNLIFLKMNLGMTITSTVLVLLVTTPIALIQQQQKKKERKLLKTLKTIANQHNSTLTEYDVFKNSVIGLDKKENNLVFYKKNLSTETVQLINLNEFKSCEILNLTKANKQNKQDIIRLQLILNPIDNTKEKETIEFFNHTEDFQLNGELDVIRKWEHIINSSLK